MLETIGFTEEDRRNDILSHKERKFWIMCLLSQALYLLIMTSFIFCACAFEDIGKKYHEVTVKMILFCLLIFNCLCYLVFVGQILYTREYAKFIESRYSDAGLKEHFERIKELLDMCATKYTQFDLDDVSHLYEHNGVQE